MSFAPPHDCPLCPRLVAFRQALRREHPDWHNNPVPQLGPLDARLLIVGLAPSAEGANRTGRKYTGAFAGEVLYPALLAAGFARGRYGPDNHDDLELVDCRLSDALHCAPPANLPTPEETRTCSRTFLAPEIIAMPRVRIVLALGGTAHRAVCAVTGTRGARFGHGTRHRLANGAMLVGSYHPSRRNVQTGRLGIQAFQDLIIALRAELGGTE